MVIGLQRTEDRGNSLGLLEQDRAVEELAADREQPTLSGLRGPEGRKDRRVALGQPFGQFAYDLRTEGEAHPDPEEHTVGSRIVDAERELLHLLEKL